MTIEDYYHTIAGLFLWETNTEHGMTWSQSKYNGYIICHPYRAEGYHFFKIGTRHILRDIKYLQLVEILAKIDKADGGEQ